MYLENIRLINFKNYVEASLKFNEQINCFVGENGAGKTNLLDAIHYLSVTKSFQNATDQQCIRHEQPFFALMGVFLNDDMRFKVKSHLRTGEKKVFATNNNSYERISEHIGRFPAVLITPNDTDIVRGASDIRRRYFDGVISLIDKDYLDTLIRYNHALRQRNSLLKRSADQQNPEPDLLEHYDRMLIEEGRTIFEKRKGFMSEVIPVIRDHYENISDDREHIRILYRSDLDQEHFESDFRNQLRRDLVTGRTNMGIHRDEYVFDIDGFSLKKFGSQGQQKSMVIALKLAQFDLLRKKNGFKPLLLLDDIFDKLDEKRMSKIMSMVAGHAFGQIFVTDAHFGRIREVFRDIDSKQVVYNIVNGKPVRSEK